MAQATDFNQPCNSSVWPKRDFQAMLRSVKKQGLDITKLDAGYTVHAGAVLVIKAMKGTRGYLVRTVNGLFDTSEGKQYVT